MVFEKLLDLDSLNESDKKIYIQKLKKERQNCIDLEQTCKGALVSIYGSLGNEYLHFLNYRIAEAITKGGKAAIIYANKCFEEWVYDLHNNKEVLVEFGLDSIEPIIADCSSTYTHTDSCYFTFVPIRKALGFKGDIVDLVLRLNKYLQPHFENKFEEWAKSYGLIDNKDDQGERIMDFEMETISKNAVFLSKGKYVQNVIWKDGIRYREPKLKYTGIEVVSKSTPKIARKIITDSITWILNLSKFSLFESKEFKTIIRDYKKEFKYCFDEDKCISTRINGYSKFIIDDVNELKVKSGCPIHVRAAGHYNYLINKNNLSHKYEKIKNGSSVKWYYAKVDDEFDEHSVYSVFGFISGNFPIEFAPSIALSAQFNRVILEPINRIASVTGLQTTLNGGNVIKSGNLYDLINAELKER